MRDTTVTSPIDTEHKEASSLAKPAAAIITAASSIGVLDENAENENLDDSDEDDFLHNFTVYFLGFSEDRKQLMVHECEDAGAIVVLDENYTDIVDVENGYFKLGKHKHKSEQCSK